MAEHLETEHNERLRDHSAKYAGKTLIGDEIWRISIAQHTDEIRRIWAYLDTLAERSETSVGLLRELGYTVTEPAGEKPFIPAMIVKSDESDQSDALRVAVEALKAVSGVKGHPDKTVCLGTITYVAETAKMAISRLRNMGVKGC